MRHVNIPIFIPHLGCPNDCVFCNQRTISGKSDYDPKGVKAEISRALETVGDDDVVQIAFFGGSFTGIDREEMIYLLSVAKEFIDKGKVRSVRLSTRPDYINDEILGILKAYSVKTIELGIQSISDKVLEKSRRGHGSDCAKAAMRLVKEYGFELVGQMMIGLPGATVSDEVETAKAICEAGADGARIYPTVVFADTALCDMAKGGEYRPLSLEEAVERTKACKSVFIEQNVECIRVGLQSGENLADGEKVYAGDYHSAVGELVDSEIYYDRIKEYIEKNLLRERIKGQNIVIYAPRGEVSKVSGHRRSNKQKLQNEYYVKNIKVIEKNEVLRYNIILSV